MTRRIALIILTALALAGLLPAGALADGDPGSDVLVGQNLFSGPDAGLSIPQQLRLQQALGRAARAGFPVRVAIIGGPSDLGTIAGAWRKPQPYAAFLDTELSLQFKGPLLVVMPNGFGFAWPGHSAGEATAILAHVAVHAGAAGLTQATASAVAALAAHVGAAGGTGGASAPRVVAAAPTTATAAAPIILSAPASSNGRGADSRVALIALAIVLLGGCVLVARALARRRTARLPGITLGAGVAGAALLVALAIVGTLDTAGAPPSSGATLGTNPVLDPGTPLTGRAPDFTLEDESGRRVSLRSYRGKVVILAFNDSECTTICPMTSTAMLDAKAMLGRAGSQVQLLGIEANPAATSLEDVASYTQLHGLLGRWHFLTGSCCARDSQLERMWRAYKVEADIHRGLIAHTPALFVISPRGREAEVYITQQSYAAIGQLGQLLADEASRLLPGHPRVNSRLSYARIPGIAPTDTVSLPRAGGGRLTLGPGARGHLSLFFATWDQEVTSLGGHLRALSAYARSAASHGLPPLTGIDEGSVEPSPQALGDFLHGLGEPLSYPVAIDATGRLADGYEVQGAPWFVLTSPSGRILWYWEVDTQGWPSPAALVSSVRAALRRAPEAAQSPAALARELAGSPAPLAALHRQAAQLLGPGLLARIHALRGYPIVVNAWASDCAPCRAEFGLLASAAVTYGTHVAFLGADVEDAADDARSFLAQHPVSYPSYSTSIAGLAPLGVLQGTPSTFFISSTGKVRYVHDGQYLSLGTLEADISQYALAG